MPILITDSPPPEEEVEEKDKNNLEFAETGDSRL